MRILSVAHLEIMAWTPTALSVAFTLGRYLIRYYKHKRMGWDDILNGVAVIFLLSFLGTWQVVGPPLYQEQLFQQGLTSTRPPAINSRIILSVGITNSLLFWCTIYSVKASFLALYWIAFNVSDRFRIAWWLVTVYTVVAFLTTFLMTFWKCGSPKDFLDERSCAEVNSSTTLQILVTWCVLDVIGDIIMMALPLAMIRQIAVNTAKRLGLALIFGLVIINIIFDILRTAFTLERELLRFPFENNTWCHLQITTAVIVCALPCYGALLSHRKKPSSPVLQVQEPGFMGEMFRNSATDLPANVRMSHWKNIASP